MPERGRFCEGAERCEEERGKVRRAAERSAVRIFFED
jgi:hypothetical protein